MLDRLYGYEVSPVLWKKVMPKLSAGRVQSVATRIVVERERARMRFVQAGYWDLEGVFDPRGRRRSSSRRRWCSSTARGWRPARLRAGDRSAQGRLDVVVLDEASARDLPARLEGAAFEVRAVEEQAVHPQALRAVHDLDAAAGGGPQAPLLRAADHADRPAAVRERPHHLHAHRQHQPVGDGAQRRPAAGPRALRPGVRPGRPAPLRGKVKNAQEAHEAIRPSGDVFRTPGELAREVVRRRAAALRADLAAHRRLPDGRRPRHERQRPPRRADRRRHRRRVRRQRQGHHLPGLPAGLRRGQRRPRRRARDDRAAPAAGRGRRRARRRRARRRRATPPARRPASPRRRWSSGSRSSASAGRRPTRRIITTVQDRGYVWKKGTRPRPDLAGVRGDRAARAALRPARRLRLHRLAGGGPRRHRRRPRATASTG